LNKAAKLKTVVSHTQHFINEGDQPQARTLSLQAADNASSAFSILIARLDKNELSGLISQLIVLSALISGIINLILLIP
jgi:hypothetical protein